uniref:Uncharacterized protein n=1 Tax=Oryza glumipatula TaxID=40148 RepID=A0A0E0AE56_9ORYZ
MAMSRRSDVRRGPCICGMPQARRSETATSFGCGRSMGLRGREAGGANGKARERAAWRGVTRPHQLQAIEQERTLQLSHFSNGRVKRIISDKKMPQLYKECCNGDKGVTTVMFMYKREAWKVFILSMRWIVSTSSIGKELVNAAAACKCILIVGMVTRFPIISTRACLLLDVSDSVACVEHEALEAALGVLFSALVGAIKLVLDAEVVELVQHVLGVVGEATEFQEQLLQRGVAGLSAASESSSILMASTLGPSSVVAAHASTNPPDSGLSALPTTHRAAFTAADSIDLSGLYSAS